MVTAMKSRKRRNAEPKLNVARALGSLVMGLVLAAGLALQAASSTLTRANPAIATQLFPANGLAREQAVARSLMAEVEKPEDLPAVADKLGPGALAAVEREPLSPKAHAILAMAAGAGQSQSDILASSSALNRRDLLMQGLVLERQVAAREPEAAFKTLDRLLRVHPEQRAALWPVIRRALSDNRALTAFATVLDGSSPWHRNFLIDTATKEDDALLALSRLRPRLPFEDAEFDRLLVRRLFQTGEIEAAFATYESALRSEGTDTAGMGWRSEFAPIEWRLVDESGLRAQMALDQTDLEIFVRSGKGGVVAERLIANMQDIREIVANHDLTPPGQIGDVRLQLRCQGADEPYFDQPFTPERSVFRVGNSPANCGFTMLAIQARAWTGRSAIRGTIEPLRIVTR